MKKLIIVLFIITATYSCDDKEEGTFYNVTITIVGNGQVTPASGPFEEGSVITLQATADNTSKFAGWTGDIDSQENPLEITVDKDLNITANFAGDADQDGVIDSEDLCGNTPTGATVDETGCQYLFLDENGVTIKARSTASAGDTEEFMGVTYTIISDETDFNAENAGQVVTTLVTNMKDYLSGKDLSGQSIAHWDVSNVTTMQSMFSNSTINQDISSWDVSNVTDMSFMFFRAGEFNQDISSWDVSNVTNMAWMFFAAVEFNQDLSSWNVSSVTNLSAMFALARKFNQDISSWDVSSVTDMGDLFVGSDFNQDISSWDVSNVTRMSSMFADSNFDQDISSWNVSKVIGMSAMFTGTAFNHDISTWDVSNVLTMGDMFSFSSFNQNIARWDVSSVVDMSYMFRNAVFNQDLSTWDVSKVTNCTDFADANEAWTLPKPNFTLCNPD